MQHLRLQPPATNSSHSSDLKLRSIVSGLLAFCWVQRYKVDKQTHLAQTLEELLNEETFVLDTLSPQHNDHFEPLTGDLVSIQLKKKLEAESPCLASTAIRNDVSSSGEDGESDLESSHEAESAWWRWCRAQREDTAGSLAMGPK